MQGSWQAVSRAQASPAPCNKGSWQPCREQEQAQPVIKGSDYSLSSAFVRHRLQCFAPPVQRALNKVELAQGRAIWTVGMEHLCRKPTGASSAQPREEMALRAPEVPTGSPSGRGRLVTVGNGGRMREQVQVETQAVQPGHKGETSPR